MEYSTKEQCPGRPSYGCSFCSISSGESPAKIISESLDHLVFLDLQPNTPGQSVVIPRKHYLPSLADMPRNEVGALFSYANDFRFLLAKAMGLPDVSLVLSGNGVNHAHIKLYPVDVTREQTRTPAFHLAPEKREPLLPYSERKHLTTKPGRMADPESLELLASQIRKNLEAFRR